MAVKVLLLALAVAAFCLFTDHRARQRASAAERAFPPLGQLVTVNGHRIHVLTMGSGPDLVLIHGASGNLRDVSFALMGLLAPYYRVTAFDRPGLGWSEDLAAAGISPMAQADALRAAAAQLGIHHPIVLGHSYGGAVAMAWALADPDTAALVIVSGATMPWPGDLDLLTRVTASRVGGLTVNPLIAAYVPEATATKAIAGIFAPQLPPPGYADYIGAALTLRWQSFQTNARQVNGLKPFVTDMSRRYPTLTLPVELIHGDADTTVPAAIHAIPLSHLMPNAHLTLLPGIGHMAHHADPQAILAAIRRAATRARLP